jgi:thiamine-monophosphate kinase
VEAMSEPSVDARLSEIGEKALIHDFIKPYFNAADDPTGVGDDCGMVSFGDEIALFSTDRVPSDLTAFTLGILDFFGLGDYLARLNLSDIAACGGQAIGLLLNLGLPNNISYSDVRAICRGFGTCATRHGSKVLGGDITSACELSISATSIGKVARGQVLTRRGARPGDSIFISRPLGLTPAALRVFVGKLESSLSGDSLALLRGQFTDTQPMLSLGQLLAASGHCGACMDNTDGVGQSLSELSEASNVAFVVHAPALQISPVIKEVARYVGLRPFDLVFDGGADFSLVGTLRGKWTNESASARFDHPLEIIGQVEAGNGVWLEHSVREPLAFRGWNYFSGR